MFVLCECLIVACWFDRGGVIRYRLICGTVMQLVVYIVYCFIIGAIERENRAACQNIV